LNILFDTNVILDALLDRKPFSAIAVLLMDAAEKSIVNGFLCAHSVTTIYYLMEKTKERTFARQNIRLLLDIFAVAPVTRVVLQEALDLDFSDYEDAVVHESAISINADGIVTGNSADYSKSSIAVYSPAELLSAIGKI
jgi:predicted nucleic acid-binding protein